MRFPSDVLFIASRETFKSRQKSVKKDYRNLAMCPARRKYEPTGNSASQENSIHGKCIHFNQAGPKVESKTVQNHTHCNMITADG